MKNQTQFGIVVSFSDQHCSGWMRINGEPQEAKFLLDSQREMIEGVSEPVFGPVSSQRFPIPSPGAQVAVQLEIGYVSKFVPNVLRGLERVVDVVVWDYRFRHQDIWQRIAKKPIFEVWEYILIDEQPTSGNGRRLVATGTAQELQARFVRGSTSDQFAPEVQVLTLTVRRRFFLKSPDGQLISHHDPRPLPAGVVEVVPPALNEHGMILATGVDLKSLQSATVARPASSRARVAV